MDNMELKMKEDNDIHEFGSCPLRSRRDYGERTASGNEGIFNQVVDKILERLSGFSYGCVYTDGSCETDTAVMDKRDGMTIKVQSPLEFWRRNIGMCHDASVLVDAVLRKEGIEHRCHYISSDQPPHYPTHSFITAEGAGGIRIIDVFAVKCCIYPEVFASHEEAAQWRFRQWLKTDNDGIDNAVMFNGDKMPPPSDFLRFSEAVVESFEE